jgi:DNA-binding MarR family transcriptional regulator
MNTVDDDLREMVMASSRALVGIAARSLAEVAADVSLAQFRVLLILDGSSRTMGELSQSLAVHPSTVTRTCDLLVGKGLIRRHGAADNRRVVCAELTRRGRRLVAQAMDRRRALIDDVLGRMPPAAQRRVARSLAEFAATAGEVSDQAWTLGWSLAGTDTDDEDD